MLAVIATVLAVVAEDIKESLVIAGIGMLAIFLVIAVIFGLVALMNRVSAVNEARREDDAQEDEERTEE